MKKKGFTKIATFSDEVSAKLAKASLAAAGIESYLSADDAGGMLRFLEFSAGIQLLVADDSASEARAILSTPASEERA